MICEKHKAQYQRDLKSLHKPKDRKRYEACIYLVEHEATLREIEKKYSIPISTLDWWIHNKLSKISHDLYIEVCNQFIVNIKNINKRRFEK